MWQFMHIFFTHMFLKIHLEVTRPFPFSKRLVNPSTPHIENSIEGGERFSDRRELHVRFTAEQLADTTRRNTHLHSKIRPSHLVFFEQLANVLSDINDCTLNTKTKSRFGTLDKFFEFCFHSNALNLRFLANILHSSLLELPF